MKKFAIDHFPWDRGNDKPESFARLERSEEGLTVQLRSRQAHPRCEVSACGGAICTDDCLEFFLTPFPEKGLYLNMEVNARGIYHLGLGTGRHGRAVFQSPAEDVTVNPVREGEFWGADVFFARDFFLRWFGGYPQGPMKGNFYKCGDHTASPHWGMWTPYDSLPEPDFHRPELFGDII